MVDSGHGGRGRLEAAKLLADAWLAGKTIEFPDELLPADRAAAYAVQEEMAEILAGEPSIRVVGWKVGATSPGVQRAEGYDGPIPGRIFASTVYGDGARVDAGRWTHAKVEAELAFRFRESPGNGGAEISLEGLAEHVELLPAFDITSSRYAESCRAEWDSREKMLAGIADNGNGGAVVLGSPAEAWRGLAITEIAPELRVGDDGAARVLWGEERGDPLRALLWTVHHVYRRGFAPARGDVILTGSLIEPQVLRPGDRVHCEFIGLGPLGFQFGQG